MARYEQQYYKACFSISFLGEINDEEENLNSFWSIAENVLERTSSLQACAGFLSLMTGNHKLRYPVELFQYFTLLTVLKKHGQHLSRGKVRLNKETLQNFSCNSVLLSSIKRFCVEDDGSIITCLGAINTAFATKFYPWHSENRPAIIKICLYLYLLN